MPQPEVAAIAKSKRTANRLSELDFEPSVFVSDAVPFSIPPKIQPRNIASANAQPPHRVDPDRCRKTMITTFNGHLSGKPITEVTTTGTVVVWRYEWG